MIVNFKCKETENLWNGFYTKKIPQSIKKKALIKLNEMDVALKIRDLETPYSNQLELLKGDRKGQYSIRINQQYRICFIWQNNNVHDVEIVDYH